MLSRKEIVNAAIAHRATPHVPYHIDVLPPVHAALERHYGDEDIDRSMGNYLRWINAPKQWERVGENLERDEFGVVWSVNEFNRGYIAEHPLAEPTLEGYKFPNFDYRARFAHIPRVIAQSPEAFHVVWTGDLFERAHFLRGLDNILVDMKLTPEFVHELLDELLGIVLRNAEAILQYPVDAIFLSDDYGLQANLMMSPTDWRTFIKPRLAQVVEFGHQNSRKVFLHSCGNVRKVLPDLVEIGLDVLHPIQPEAMDIEELKKSFGDRITFYGGISTQRTLSHGKPEEVKQEVEHVAAVMAENGGFILAPGITLQHDVPWDNLLAFIEACRKARAG